MAHTIGVYAGASRPAELELQALSGHPIKATQEAT